VPVDPPTVEKINQAINSHMQTTHNQSRYQPARTRTPVQSGSRHVNGNAPCPAGDRTGKCRGPAPRYATFFPTFRPVTAFAMAGNSRDVPTARRRVGRRSEGNGRVYRHVGGTGWGGLLRCHHLRGSMVGRGRHAAMADSLRPREGASAGIIAGAAPPPSAAMLIIPRPAGQPAAGEWRSTGESGPRAGEHSSRTWLAPPCTPASPPDPQTRDALCEALCDNTPRQPHPVGGKTSQAVSPGSPVGE